MAGYVYIMGNKQHRLYKIGITADVSKRIKEVQTGSPYALSVIVACQCEEPRQIEKELHDSFAKFRLKGEWFELNLVFLNLAIRTLRNREIGITYRQK